MTLEEIETILFEELSFSERLDEIQGEKEAAKLILASHLRSQIELLNKNIDRLKRIQMRFISDSDSDKYVWRGLNLAYSELNIHKSRLSEQLTKLNQ